MSLPPRAESRGLRIAALGLLALVACTADTATDRPGRADDLQDVITGARALVASAPLIVVADVREITPGRTTEGLAFEDVHLDVTRRLKGSTGGALVLEQAAPEGRSLGAPRFQPGDRHLLLLRPSRSHAGRHVPVHQGRYRIEDGRVVAAQPGPVADAWDGAALEDVLRQIRAVTVDREGVAAEE